MGEAKVNAGVKIPPDLKAALERQAAREDKTLSKLCEVLLSWAYQQLQIAGNSFSLKSWEAQPPLSASAVEPTAAGTRSGTYQQVTTQAEGFARAARGMAERPHEGGHEQRLAVSEKDAARHSGRPRRRAHS
ncbi:MAG TPA: hypothetical protein VNJ52_13625 [Patescibacteria group bacterium]|nr:hypothetical protein [Patescibacteria group bacterium]